MTPFRRLVSGPLRHGGLRALPATRLASLTTSTIPTVDAAKSMPRHVSELSGEALFLMAKLQGDPDACRERLRREIMRVDGVTYQETTPKLLEMNEFNSSSLGMGTLPFRLGIYTAIFSGWISIPLVFHLPLVTKFNDLCVTADYPEPGELDTVLEVGSWAWNWMEPPLGTISFTLLCLQFARDQRVNLGEKPYPEWYRDKLGKKLAEQFPRYDANVVADYGGATAFDDDADEIADCDKYIAAMGK